MNSLNLNLTTTSKQIPKQRLVWQLLLDEVTEEITFGGGAGGGKTKTLCEWLLFSAVRYPRSRWGLGRKDLTALRKTTLLTMLDVLRDNGWREKVHYELDFRDNLLRLYNDSVIFFLDLDYYPHDPEYERLGSYELTGAGVDEAGQIRHKCKEVLKTRIRYKLDEFGLVPKVLMSCNPTKNFLYHEFYKPSKEGKLEASRAFVQILARDNPFLPASYIKTLQNIRDKATRERLWNGNWEFDDDPNALFAYDAMTDLPTNPIKHEEKEIKHIIVDAARLGGDLIVMTVWLGLELIKVKVKSKQRTDVTETDIRALAMEYGVPMSRVLVDEDGVGGGIVDHLGCKGFQGGGSPIVPPGNDYLDEEQKTYQRPNFLNLRAQCYVKLADLMTERSIKLSDLSEEQLTQLYEELGQVKIVNSDKDGKLRVTPKDEIKQAIGRSPDIADTVMMRMYFELEPDYVPQVGWL